MKVDGKKAISINVNYKPIPEGSNNGRLIIEAEDHTSWTFYLQGD